MSSIRALLHLFLGFAVISASFASICPNDNYYLSLSNSDLYNAATGGKKINGCVIQVSPGSGACYLYVKTPETSARGYNGWPRTTGGLGTGCVKAPDLPKRVRTCYYRDPRYDLSQHWINLFCTENGRNNAAAQLRHAILNGQCNKCESGTPGYACPGDSVYEHKDVDSLYHLATGGRRINGCYISVNSGSGACYLYVKTPETSARGYNGWPRTTGGLGTGCVKAPDLPKRVRTCYYKDPRYDLSQQEINSFCTDHGRANAVAQLKHAVVKGQCNHCGVLST